MANGSSDKRRGASNSASVSFERKIKRARTIMYLEQIWPRLWLPMGLIGVFILASTFGLWPALPFWAHVIALAVFVVGLLASFMPILAIVRNNRHDAIRWLEKKSGLAHRPATILDDTLSNHDQRSADDPASVLWQIHKKRAKDHVEAMATGLPRPKTALFDRFALRVPLMLALAATIGLYADRLGPGLAQAFAFSKTTEMSDLRIDAWISPPAYTGHPPVMLVDGAKSVRHQLNASGDASSDGKTVKSITIPEMSELVIRISGPNAQETNLVLQKPGNSGARSSQKSKADKPPKIEINQDGIVHELRTKLAHTINARLDLGSSHIKSWQFIITPDHAPAIALTKKPKASPRGSLRLSYRVADDYRVIEALAHFTKRAGKLGSKGGVDLPLSSPASNNLMLPLGTPPTVPLLLPKGNTKRGTASTYKDLTSHPWAGLNVQMVLSARDEAGKTGKSELVSFKLPERKFTKPLAQSIIALRRTLVETPYKHHSVVRILNQRTKRLVNSNHPDLDNGVYLGLRTAYWRLLGARKRQTIRSVVDQLWEVALTIEDGNLSKAERELRSAQDKLMDALSHNAPKQEIAKLMKELRQALSKFLQAMAKKQQDQQQNADQKQMPGNQRSLTSRELEKMLRDIENMSKTGARDAARQMLSQLREMLENLQSGRPQPSAQAKKAREQLDKLGKMIMQQRRLLDETHKRNQQNQGQQQQQGQRQGRRQGERRGQRQGQRSGGRQGRQQGQQGKGQQPGQHGQKGLAGQSGAGNQQQQAGAPKLQRRQGQLLEGLNDLMDQMGRNGTRIPQDLMRAGSNMGQAERQLGKRQLNSAGRQQGKALENLRKGATEMVEKMMKNSPGQGRQSGRQGRDPLGRAQRTSGPEFGDDVKVPKEIDTRRARDILEELRRRLGQSTRPPSELDYLERLIEQF